MQITIVRRSGIITSLHYGITWWCANPCRCVGTISLFRYEESLTSLLGTVGEPQLFIKPCLSESSYGIQESTSQPYNNYQRYSICFTISFSSLTSALSVSFFHVKKKHKCPLCIHYQGIMGKKRSSCWI